MYYDVKWTNPEQHLKAVVQVTVKGLFDKELPCRTEAAITLSRIVGLEGVPALLKPHLPQILKQFFVLIDELGNEVIVATLSEIVSDLGDEMAPFAVAILDKMIAMFTELVKRDEEDDEAAMTANHCFGTMCVLLDACSSQTKLINQMELKLRPLIDGLLTPRGLEFFEDVCMMLQYLVRYNDEITPFLWDCLPRLAKAQLEWAHDYLNNIVPVFDQYIDQGTDVFAEKYVPYALSMVQKVYEGKDMEHEANHGAQLMELMVSYCKGKIDKHIPAIIRFSRMGMMQNDMTLKYSSLNSFAACAAYNPTLFCQLLKQAKHEDVKLTFNTWLSLNERMEKDVSKRNLKLSAIGLTSLLSVPISQLPETLSNAMEALVQGVITILIALKNYKEGEAIEEDDFELDGVDGVTFSDVAEDVDVDHEVGSIMGFAKKSQDALLGLGMLGGMEEDSDDFVTPMDAMEPFVVFGETFQQFSQRERNFYQRWINSLNAGQKGEVQGLINEAKIRHERLLKKQSEKKAGQS
eukprot:g222.t1